MPGSSGVTETSRAPPHHRRLPSVPPLLKPHRGGHGGAGRRPRLRLLSWTHRSNCCGRGHGDYAGGTAPAVASEGEAITLAAPPEVWPQKVRRPRSPHRTRCGRRGRGDRARRIARATRKQRHHRRQPRTTTPPHPRYRPNLPPPPKRHRGGRAGAGRRPRLRRPCWPHRPSCGLQRGGYRARRTAQGARKQQRHRLQRYATAPPPPPKHQRAGRGGTGQQKTAAPPTPAGE